MRKLPPLVDIDIPAESRITVCGDIHGQFYDLMNIFALNGLPSATHMYLFNGDFVDRGAFSCECIFTLFAYKLLMPASMHLSRGNHESDDMNRVYGFDGEVKAKYDSDLMRQLFSETFCAIPLGNVIQSKILVLHGGLFSSDGVKLAELREIDRFRQPPGSISDPKGKDLLMTEMLWSDPME